MIRLHECSDEPNVWNESNRWELAGAGQAEHALGDVVALDFAGARRCEAIPEIRIEAQRLSSTHPFGGTFVFEESGKELLDRLLILAEGKVHGSDNFLQGHPIRLERLASRPVGRQRRIEEQPAMPVHGELPNRGAQLDERSVLLLGSFEDGPLLPGRNRSYDDAIVAVAPQLGRNGPTLGRSRILERVVIVLVDVDLLVGHG